MFGTNIQFLRKKRNLKQDEMPVHVGVSRATWSDYERSNTEPDLNTLKKIAEFFGIDIDTLLTDDIAKSVDEGKLILDNGYIKKPNSGKPIGKGNGKLLAKLGQEESPLSVVQEPLPGGTFTPKVITIDTAGNENVVMVPVKARAGYLNGYGDPKYISKLPAYRLPGLNNGHYRIFEVDGKSMHDTLNDKDLVICQYVEQLRLVRDDRIHVVVTKNDGVVVKTVLNRLEKDGKLILKSENYKDRDDYPTIVCNPEDILEIWYCIGYISRIFRRSNDQYRRLIDLEGRLTLLEAETRKK